jgi:hypothetical protein
MPLVKTLPLRRTTLSWHINTDVKRLISPLWVALAHLVLSVLQQYTNFMSKHWALPVHLFKVKFQDHRHNHTNVRVDLVGLRELNHPNPRSPTHCSRNVVWRLIIYVTIQEITASQALTTFFNDPEVHEVLASEEDNSHSTALGVSPLFTAFTSLTWFRIC